MKTSRVLQGLFVRIATVSILLLGPSLVCWMPSSVFSSAILLAQTASPSGSGPSAEKAASGGSSHPAAHKLRYDFGMGGKAHTSMFGVQAEGYKFVYVIDRSGSMGGSGPTALKAAKAELLASLKDLEQTHQFQIVFYNEKPALFNPTGDPHRTLFATEQNKSLAERFIDTITAFDGTRHDEALMLAVKLHPDVIFWLTDADEPKLSGVDLTRISRLAAGITIHAIEFGSGPQPESDNFLVQMARQTGGTHHYVDLTKEPPPAEPPMHAEQRR
jgi:hypothetical protein